MALAHRIDLRCPAAQLLSAPQSAITDALGRPPDDILLADALAHPSLLAALLAHDAQFELRGGGLAPLDDRLLRNGGIDIHGVDGALPADVLVVPVSLDASALAPAAPFAVAVRISPERDCSVAIAGAAPHPLRARQTEAALRGRSLNDDALITAAETLRGEAQPYGIGDVTDPARLDALAIALIRACEQARARL